MADLVTISDVKDFLQVTGTASDALITTYMDIVEAEVEAYVDRDLGSNTYEEFLYYESSDYDNSNYRGLEIKRRAEQLFLSNYPATDLTLVEGDTTVSSADYRLFADNGVILSSRTFSTYDDNLKASYTAGYTTASAPADLKGVIYMGVKALFESNATAKAGQGGVSSKKIKDFSVSYGSNQNSFVSADGTYKPYIMSNKTTLDRYKRVNI